MKRLGVNIDHVATVRNARGEKHPSPLKAAIIAMNNGANSITIHLREDRRHILDNDLNVLTRTNKIPINLEMAPNYEMLKIALKNKPNYICIVPEKRKELTTEGVLNLLKDQKKIKDIINILNKKKIRTSLFINPTIKDIQISLLLKANCVELHTGKLADLVKKNKNYKNEIFKIKKTAKYAHKNNIEVHVGHGLDYKTTRILSKIKEISEFNIGHFIIGESIFLGLGKTIKNFKKILNK